MGNPPPTRRHSHLAPGVNGSLAYPYDKVGNRKQRTSTLLVLPTGLWNYDANDRITTDIYDANGNTISAGGTADAYDFEDHLVSHGFMTFVYDGDGNRVAKTVGGVTTSFLVDTMNPTGYAQVLDELQSAAVTRSYAYGLELISQTQLTNAEPPANPWATSYYGYDGHGSVRYLTDTTGAITDTYDYDAFGNLIASTGSTPNLYLFAGEQYDPDLGLYYNRARYMDTRVGRFWGMDTDEGDDDNPLSLHKYLYANANPVDGTDPSGNDDIAGMMVGMSMSMTINSMPSLQSQTYIGGQNADPDLDIRKAIADTARSYVGSHNWLDTAGSNKCNAFVFDVLTQVGHAPPKLGGSIRYLLGYQLGVTSLLKYAPIAGQWADASIDIPNWTVVSAGPQQAQPGDIIAEKINYSDASGHVGIVVGSQQTASADSTAKPPGTITISNYGFRSASDKRPYGKASNSVVRRFSVFQADAPLGGGGADAF
jgi:RHS repeat-associated protein